MKSSKCDYLNSKVFQISELHEVSTLSPLSSDNILSEAILEGKKDEIKSEVLYQPSSGECTISSSPSLVLENVSSVECPQLLNESPDNQVIMVSDFLPSPVLLSDAHNLNSVSFNPVSFLNDNSTTVTWCNESVPPLSSSQTGLYSHLINGQKIVQNERSPNNDTYDIISECVKVNKSHESEAEVPEAKFESNSDSLQPIILITTTLSPSNNVRKVNGSLSRSRSGTKIAKDKVQKKKYFNKVADVKKNTFKMKAESSSSDDCLSSVSDASVMNLSHNNEILNSLLLNGDNLSSLFPTSSALQTADLSNPIQIDLSTSSLNLDTFDAPKMDGKKYVFKALDCNSSLIDPSNFTNGIIQSDENSVKSKSSFSSSLELGVYMNSNLDHCDDNCIDSTSIKPSGATLSKTNLWNIKLKQKESLTNSKIFSNSDPVLEPSDNFLTSINLNESPKSIDLFADKIQSGSRLSMSGQSAKMKARSEVDVEEVGTEIESMELNALQLSSSPPGYTAQLLSQLSHAHSLPSISSSQVSSVLSALEQSEKQLPSAEVAFPQMVTNSSEAPIKDENINDNDDEDVKVVDTVEDNLDFKPRNKARLPSQKVQLIKCELNGYACYKCGLCPYLSMTQQSVMTHFQQHQSKLLRRAIRCIGCKNQFYSKFLLKAHLLQDHEVLVDELHPILDAVFAANKPQAVATKRKQSKFSIISEPIISKEPEVSLSPLISSVTPSITMAPSISASSNSIASIRNSVNVAVLSSSNPIESIESIEPLHPVPSMPSIQSLQPLQAIEEEFIPVTTGASYEPLVQPPSSPISTSLEPVEENTFNSVVEEAEVNESLNMSVDVESKAEAEAVTVINVINEEKMEAEKRKVKKTKVRPIAINKLLTQQKDTSPATSPVPSIPLVPLKSKKNSDNGVKCGLDGCSARFTDMNNLEFHQRFHDLRNLTFKCLDCDHTNPDWSRFSLHLWRSHNINIELYSCALCNYKTSSRSQLHNLHYRIHGEERPFLCDLCGKGFKTTKQLRNHKAIHRLKAISKTEIKEILCNICGCSFADSRKLQLHENNIHKKLRPFLCNYCGHKASSRSSLRMHIRQHTGEKPFSCDECDYVTGDHNSMRRHKMRHSGAKRYSCPHCSYACIQSNTYKSHLKRKHPGLDEGLMFCCHLCSFVSVKKENLMSHMTEHKESENENDSEMANDHDRIVTSENGDDIEVITLPKIERKTCVVSSVKSLDPTFNLDNVTVIDVMPSNQTLVLQNLGKSTSTAVIASDQLESLINNAELVIDVKDSIRTNGFHESTVVFTRHYK